jgi:abequosyltransferase
MQKKISIVIPTYNRNEILCRNLILLLPQITAEVEVVVLDNNSIIPVIETMRQLLPNYYADKIKVVQNRFNVGGNQNVLRCFEFCNGQYMWLLGDDDSPDPNAVEHILMEISKNPDAVVYNMYSDAPSHGFRQSSKVVNGSLGYLSVYLNTSFSGRSMCSIPKSSTQFAIYMCSSVNPNTVSVGFR